MNHSLALVVAVADNGVIGKDGGLPWHLPADLKHFKRLTVGHTLVMGRRTHESIGRPLPRRRSIVLTRDGERLQALTEQGVETAPDLETALAMTAEERVFVIGGSSVYRAALPLADELYLTRVHAEVAGDVRFPAVDWRQWRLAEAEPRPADERHAHTLTFERHVRVR